MKNQSFRLRLGYACFGIVATFRSEASFRTQSWMGGIALVVLTAIRPPLTWLALCFLSAGAVFALELMNTSLEHLADRLHPERHSAIQLAKDCSAGAVLVASVTALIVGSFTVAVGLGWLKG